MEKPTFEQFAEFVRGFARCSSKTIIAPSMRFEKDLGITGDDGTDLLLEAERHFGILLHSEGDGFKKTFNLAPNEYLFNSEGFLPFAMFIRLLSGRRKPVIREFTVGELYDAVCQASLQ